MALENGKTVVECARGWGFHSACFRDPRYEYKGKQYCLFHYPSEEKEEDFSVALESELEEGRCNFAGVYFPSGSKGFTIAIYERTPYDKTTPTSFSESTGGYFNEVTFTDIADFRYAIFSEQADFIETTFEKQAIFLGATFKKGVNFHGCTFSEEANFYKATFTKQTKFSEANFSQLASFSEATFGEEVDFQQATFTKQANFYKATLKESAAFDSIKTLHQASFDLRDIVVEKPERVSFSTTHLRPSWFVDVDAQKFNFSDIEWFRASTGRKVTLKDEIKALERRSIQVPESLRKLTKGCRKLMNNAEENRDYPTANEMHYWSMDAQRKEGWSRLGLIPTLYWALSGYGVRPLKAFVVLIIMSLVFALLYSWPAIGAAYSLQALEGLTYGYWGGPLDYIGYFLRTEMYSLGALARLNPEPKPTPGLFQTLVIVAGILGPLQIALFLLAVRRKVMR